MALTTDQFRDQVIASGLLTAEDLSSILTAFPAEKPPRDGEQLARELVRQKRLTRFQAEQIYLGKGKSLVLGNYTILEKLGQGGMGMVLKAEHKRLKRLVALKVLSPAALKTPDALKRFHREVEAAAKLRHTNVVATDDADEAKGTHFLVMEYVEGSDLSALVKKKGPLSVGQAVQCILQAARGLEYAHEQGVVHRDIKPANLLLDTKGTVKILDMGLARIEGDSAGRAELTSTGAVMGTVDYMAPEQALSTKSADARSDIYSLGISLWYLLTGKCVFDGDTLMAKLLAHRDAPIPSLCAARSEVSASIDAVFQKMVAKQAKDRYQSMTEVIRDLEACQEGASSTSSLSVSTADDDANPFSFLNTPDRSTTTAATTRQARPTAKHSAAGAAAEATMITGNLDQTTDPGTMTSVRSSQKRTQRSSSRSAASPPWWQDRRVQIGGGAAAVLLLLAVVFLFQTPSGTLRVEILDPEVEMKVKGTELTFQGSDLEPVSLKAGEKTLLVTRGDLSFETEGFTLKKGTETRVKVELLGDKLVVNGGGKVIAEHMIPSKGITASTTGSDPAFPQWLKDVQAMPAEKQLEAVSKKMIELNPGFDGKFSHAFPSLSGHSPVIERGKVVEVGFSSSEVTNIAPLRAFGTLRGVACLGRSEGSVRGKLADLSPLRGMEIERFHADFNPLLRDVSPIVGPRLRELQMAETGVTDLSPLRGSALTSLYVSFSGVTDIRPLAGLPLETLSLAYYGTEGGVTDLTPLKGMPLKQLSLRANKGLTDLSGLAGLPLASLDLLETSVESLEPLRGMLLTRLELAATKVSDMSPLKTMPLKEIGLDFDAERDTEWLRSIKTLETINGKPVAEFWKEVEEQKQGKPGIRPGGPAPPPAKAPFDAKQARAHQEAWAKHLGVPVEFTNSIGMKFVLIPPGEFTIGSTEAEIEAVLRNTGDDKLRQAYVNSEGPQHKVILTRPIYFGVNEVTQAEYQKVMGVNPSQFAPTGMRKDVVAGRETAEYPVEMVSWNDAAEFCAKLSQQEKLKPSYFRAGETITSLDGTGYSLPSEAEWEYACRAGTATKYWIGDKDEDLAHVCWFVGNSGFQIHAAGELQANPFGLADMHGNVWEWVHDGWDPNRYGQFQEKPAIDPSSPPSTDSRRVVRGGVFHLDASYCRSSVRHGIEHAGRGDNIGFRVSLAVNAVQQARKSQTTSSTTGTGWPADAPKPAIAPFDAAQAKKHQEAWAKHLGVPVEYTNSIGMKFRLIPPGEFMMGSTPAEIAAAPQFDDEGEFWPACAKGEAPRHAVRLSRPFYLAKHEVTQSAYLQLMGNNPSDFSTTGGFKERVVGLDTSGFPVEMVDWDDAVAFCNKLSAQESLTQVSLGADTTMTPPIEGNGYRLLTEAEWEFACRAGTTTQFSGGDEVQDLHPIGYSGGNSDHRTHAVGELAANAFGLCDMHGNVWEWVLDHWDINYYQQFESSMAVDPFSMKTPGDVRAVRGGFWGTPELRCSSARRYGQPIEQKYGHNGFRIALTVEGVRLALKDRSAAPDQVGQRTFVSEEWIDVIPLIDPQRDRWEVPGLTGKNEWLVENGELVVKLSDGKPCKLLFPIDIQGRSLEWEIEFTRTSGNSGFHIDIPMEKGPCPIMLDDVYPGQAALTNQRPFQGKCSIQTAQRSSIRLRIENSGDTDRVECWFNDNSLGSWSGPRADIGREGFEGYPHAHRSGLWVPAGEFVFHKIRIKMLKDGVAYSLRAVPPSPVNR